MVANRFKIKKTFWRINQNIQANQIRVIGPEGKQLGIFSKSEALQKAQEFELDLVEIAPTANPPVAKIIDFTKFHYQQEKKEREARRKERKGSEQKEVWLTPFIGQNDYKVRQEKIKEFLEEGYKVRVVVKFTGSQLAHREFGYKVTSRITQDMHQMASVDQEPKFLGRQLIMVLTPIKKGTT